MVLENHQLMIDAYGAGSCVGEKANIIMGISAAHWSELLFNLLFIAQTK